jgi:hypothetical protein
MSAEKKIVKRKSGTLTTFFSISREGCFDLLSPELGPALSQFPGQRPITSGRLSLQHLSVEDFSLFSLFVSHEAKYDFFWIALGCRDVFLE